MPAETMPAPMQPRSWFQSVVSRRFALAALDVLVAAVAFAIPFSYIVGHFFISAPYLLDSGIFANLLSSGGLLQPMPACLSQSSYLGTHVSPIFYLFSVPVSLLSIPPPLAFATYIGLTYLTFYVAVKILFPAPGAMVAALIVPGLGLLLLQILYPHTEALFCALFFLSTALFYGGHRKRYVYAIFALCLLVREDAGFHACAFGGVSWLYCLWLKKPKAERNHWLLVACVGFAASLACMAFQKLFFAGTDNALRRVYLGDPAFAHVTTALVWARLKTFALHKSYIWIPLAVSLALAWIKRDLLFYLGWLATAPWLLLSLLAKSDSAGTLYSYYSFPLALGILSLLLGLRRHYGTPQLTLVVCGLFACDLFFFAKDYQRIIQDGIHLAAPFDYKKTEALLRPFVPAGAGVASNVAALYPNLFKPAQVDDASAPLYLGWRQQPTDAPAHLASDPVKIFKLSPELPFLLYVDTSRADPRLPPSIKLDDRPLSMIYVRHQTLGLTVRENIAICPAAAPDRKVIWGPYMKLKKGAYEVVYHFDEIRAAADARLTLAVAIRQNHKILAKTEIVGPASPSAPRLVFTLENDTEGVEFIVQKKGSVSFVISDITVDRAHDTP